MSYWKLLLPTVLAFLMTACATTERAGAPSPVAGKTICLDAGHGGTADTDQFRVGPTGEREEWVNLRVAQFLREMLEERGANVVMTRTEDVRMGLKERADLARTMNADVFLSIHHNATADHSVNFPIIYYHGHASNNEAGVRLAKLLGNEIRSELFNGEGPLSVASDYTIFPGSGTAVLRHSYGIPGVIGEASFFSNPEEESRLKDPEYNRREARAYVAALEAFFREDAAPVRPTPDEERLPEFEVLQEAERMQDVAKRWREDFEEARRLYEEDGDMQEAYDLFTRSARSFPDSPVARKCHVYRAEILEEWDRDEDAETARRRAEELYVEVEN